MGRRQGREGGPQRDRDDRDAERPGQGDQGERVEEYRRRVDTRLDRMEARLDRLQQQLERHLEGGGA